MKDLGLRNHISYGVWDLTPITINEVAGPSGYQL